MLGRYNWCSVGREAAERVHASQDAAEAKFDRIIGALEEMMVPQPCSRIPPQSLRHSLAPPLVAPNPRGECDGCAMSNAGCPAGRLSVRQVDPEFEAMQERFCREHCAAFDSTDENKLVRAARAALAPRSCGALGPQQAAEPLACAIRRSTPRSSSSTPRS